MADRDESDDKNKEYIMNFALLIQQTISSKGIEYRMESQNQGISDSQIILMVETWLDKIKERFKDNISNGMMFGGHGK